MEKIIATLIIYLLIAMAIAIEHWLLADRLRRKEQARWVIGVVTIFLATAPLVILGHLDLSAWLTLLIAFGVAGLITTGLYTLEEADQVRDRLHQLRQEIFNDPDTQ